MLKLVDQRLCVRKSVVVQIIAQIGVDASHGLEEILADHRTIHLDDVGRTGRRIGQFECARLVDPTTKTFQLFLKGRTLVENVRFVSHERTSMGKTCRPSVNVVMAFGVHCWQNCWISQSHSLDSQ